MSTTPVLPTRIALDVRPVTTLPLRETYRDTRGGSVAFIPGTNLLVGQIGTYRQTQTAIWDLDTTQRVYETAREAENPHASVAVDPSGRFVAINDHRRAITQIDLSDGTERRLDIQADSIQYLPGGTLLYLRNGSIFTHTPGSNVDDQIGTHDRYDNIATNGHHLTASHRTNRRGNVEVFDHTLQTIQAYRPTDHGENWIRALAIGPDGQHVATTTRTGAYVHVVSSGTQVNTINWDYPDSVALHPQHPIIAITATSGQQQGLLIYDYRAGEVLLEHRQRHLQGVAFNDNGTYLAVGSNEGILIYSINHPQDTHTTPPDETETTRFFDAFDDLHTGANQSWTLLIAGNKDLNPNLNYVDLSGQYARFVSTGHSGRGGVVGLEIEVDLAVTDRTILGFDALARFRDVGDGCGWTCREYPANVRLELEDADGRSLRLTYAVNYGGAVQDQAGEDWRLVTTSVGQDVWARDLTFRIRDAWPNAMRITRIQVLGSGWNFDGGIDNIAIRDL